MIVIRRELPQSNNVGRHRRPPVRHIEPSRVLLTAASPPGPEHIRPPSVCASLCTSFPVSRGAVLTATDVEPRRLNNVWPAGRERQSFLATKAVNGRAAGRRLYH